MLPTGPSVGGGGPFLPPTPAGSMPALLERVASEFIQSTALARLQADMGTIAREFAGFRQDVSRLNAALGDFRDKQVEPIKRELAFLRLNLGDKANQTVTNLEVLIAHLDRQLGVVLAAQGKSPAEIGAFREHAGIQPEAPSLRQLERDGVKHVDSGALAAATEALVAQNQRLLAEIERKPGPKRRKQRKPVRRGR